MYKGNFRALCFRTDNTLLVNYLQPIADLSATGARGD